MIKLSHGAGGRLTHELVSDHFIPHFDNAILRELADAAVLDELALTTDSYVVTPRFFPGGDIGRLAVCGTVNDLAMVGAAPVALTAGFIIEEGFSLTELESIVASMARAADEAAVSIVAGDTKVVARGAIDGLFINTSGLGRLTNSFKPSAARIEHGDAVLISGTIGDHGMAIMACREGLNLNSNIISDVAPLAELVLTLRDAAIPVHALRDPTRGGVAQSLQELAQASSSTILLEERALPIRRPVRAACELLGIDPLYVANEGKMLIFAPADAVERTLEILNANRLGREAAVIGHVISGKPRVEIITSIGTRRIVRMPEGELLPRIC